MKYITSRRTLKLISVISSLTLLLVGYQNCSYNMGGSQSGSSSVEDLSNLSGAALEERKTMIIIEKKCASCHNENVPSGQISYVDNPQMLQYSGLVIPGEPDISPLYNAVVTGEMPPNELLSQEEISQISHWIKDVLTPDQSGVAPPEVDTSPLTATYTSIFKKIIQPRCLACHRTGNVSGNINLSTFNSSASSGAWVAGSSSGSKMYTEVATGQMPKFSAALSPEEISAIKTWIDGGAKNN